MAKALVDQDARDRATGDLDTSFCVEAGAGTGKTSLLVGRFLSILRSGRAEAGRIVAITFTEKAAGEMKVRLRDEIAKLLSGTDLPAKERERLEAARDGLERAPISTIHSFASAILREYPLEAGIDPRFEQLDEFESSLFLDECWQAYLARIEPPHDDTVRRCVSLGLSIERIKELAMTVYGRRGERCIEGIFDAPASGTGGAGRGGGHRPRPPGHVPREAGGTPDPADDLEAFKRGVLERAAKLRMLAEEHCKRTDDRGYRAIRRFLDTIAPIGGLTGDELEDFLLTVSMPKQQGNKSNWSPPDACTRQKEIAAELAELHIRYRRHFTDGLRNRLFSWFEAFIRFVDGRKRYAGVLDFDDLLIKARNLLRVGTALDSLRRRYRYLLVDEFQDTDPLQAEIIFLLSCAAGSGPAAGPEPGKLFIVGDPKQSIYRFRKADVEVYERVKERLAASGAYLKITQNFRSTPGVIDWVNDAFSSLITKPDHGRYQPAYEPIQPVREGTEVAVIHLDLGFGGGKPNADEVREIEGRAITRLIRKLIGEGRRVRDTETREMRPVQLKDIAVLYPVTTGIDYYEEPLREEGIPYIVEGGKLYYVRQEVRDLAAALWAIEDPFDALALVAALRSPLFGFSDEELFCYARAGGRFCYVDEGATDAERFGAFTEAFRVLRGLHRQRNARGPAGTIADLLAKTKYMELFGLRPHGEQAAANIQKAVRNARAFEGMHVSFRRFARWFRDQERLEAAEGESPLVEEAGNAVRLLTIHKSKGLQFPVVILANLLQARRRPERVFLVRGRRLVFRHGSWMETSDFASTAGIEGEKDAAETVRLLYVASTRAGDMLFIPETPGKKGLYGLLAAYLEPVGTIEGFSGSGYPGGSAGDRRPAHGVVRLRESSLPPFAGTPQAIVGFPKPRPAAVKRALGERDEWERRRRELIARASACPRVVTPSGLESLEPHEAAALSEAETGAPARGDAALRFGAAFHRVMERADLVWSVDTPALAENTAREFALEDPGALTALVQRACSSKLITGAAEASRVYREVPFSVPVEGGYLEGRIDLLYERDGVWTAVDYKTDDVAAGRVHERFTAYRNQGILYAYALQRLGFELQGGVVFYFVRPDEARRLVVTSELLAEGERLIRAHREPLRP